MLTRFLYIHVKLYFMDVIINCGYFIHSWQCLILMLKPQMRRMLGPTHKFLSKYMARWASQHNYFWIINPEMTSKEGRKYNVLVDTSTVGGVGGYFFVEVYCCRIGWPISNPSPLLLFLFLFFFFCFLFFVFCVLIFLFSFSNLTKAEVNS